VIANSQKEAISRTGHVSSEIASPVQFGREICGSVYNAVERKWLVTNGIGGFASGTISGLLTRRYHGLLIAALKPPLGRTLLVTKLEDTARYADHSYPLSANRWTDGTLDPQGCRHIERFRLNGTTPAGLACADALLEKSLWMQQKANEYRTIKMS
jgi:predicted glycogen debranching enzyme